MSVAGPSRRPPSCRRRKRLRPGVGWWGSPVRFIVDLGCGYPFLVWFVFLWLLFSGVWETLIFGTGDWFAFGEPFFCGLFTPTYPLPGHRLVPESQFLFEPRYCGWRTLKPFKIIVYGHLQGNHQSRVPLRRCEMDLVHPQYCEPRNSELISKS